MALMLAGGAGAGRLDVLCGPGDRPWVHGCVSHMGLESDAGSYLRLKYSWGRGGGGILSYRLAQSDSLDVPR